MEKVKFDHDNINLAKITPLNKPNGGKKNHGRVVWTIRQGSRFGYDLEDPFIDDSEEFDESVPDGYDTELGGFYVNSGPLHFKKVKSDTTTKDSSSEEAYEVSVRYKNQESVDGSIAGRDIFMNMQKCVLLCRDDKTSGIYPSEFDVPQVKALQMEFRANDVKVSADALHNIENFKEVPVSISSSTR